MDRLERMHIFVRVVDCLSFTRAAESLEIPRSTVSTAIKELEAEMGARLLNRTTRAIKVTEEGHFLYQKGVTLLQDYEQLQGAFVANDRRP
ncbi:MAG: LysR family transcriptional regulator, partial [Alcanivorax sp.]